ncbi:MAG: OmpA family protein, partial [Myxococcales bacterium]|nr:OmpA family protein [Myxococcales bacterium]
MEGPSDPNAGGAVTAGAATQGDATQGNATQEKPKSGDEKWIRKYRPRRMSFEFGIFGGIFLSTGIHELFDPVIQLESGNTFWRPYRKVNPDIGGRFGFYPLSFLGGEIEGAAMPTRIINNDGTTGDPSTLFRFSGHLIGQLPFWSIAPFVVIGGGGIGTTGALGNDVDEMVYFGGGVKFFINDLWLIRVDLRDNIAARLEVDAGATHYPEINLGVSVRFGGKKKESPQDSDGDGYIDSEDDCPYDPENFNGYEDEDGCPEYDRDGDGFFDNQDACPDVPGIAPDGCPESDRDGDGFLDSDDACPDTPGVEPDGCPIPDTDGDGFLDPDDKCVTEPENFNGFEDDDGCPDEIPVKVQEFTGAIKGIYFDFNKATIKPTSKPVLDRAVGVLSEFDSIRIEISGHTDNIGSADYNKNLSQQRADAVKKYLTDSGIAESRITTRGAGMDEPVATNKTAQGRAKNRRI